MFKAAVKYIIDTKLIPYLSDRLPSALVWQFSVVGDRNRLSISKTCTVSNTLFNLYSGRITIEDFAFFGHDVLVLTGSHDYRKFGMERILAVPSEGNDILIKQGAWIASRATIVGPCTVGENAVVSAGAVVNQDVPDGAIVAGVPAKVIGWVTRDYEMRLSASGE